MQPRASPAAVSATPPRTPSTNDAKAETEVSWLIVSDKVGVTKQRAAIASRTWIGTINKDVETGCCSCRRYRRYLMREITLRRVAASIFNRAITGSRIFRAG